MICIVLMATGNDMSGESVIVMFMIGIKYSWDYKLHYFLAGKFTKFKSRISHFDYQYVSIIAYIT